MPFAPDYGLFLLSQGYSGEVRQVFYDFPLDYIGVVGPGRFTTMQNRMFDETEYALSLDFDADILADILALCPRIVADQVRAELAVDPLSRRSIEFSESVSIGLEATLGEVQTAAKERFVPLIVRRVFQVSQEHLSGWAYQTLEHWKQFRPKMYRELQKLGKLRQQAQEAANRTSEELDSLLDQGLPYNQAWELVREKYMFLPSEEDQPKLGESNPSDEAD